jgi:hypothetical protein
MRSLTEIEANAIFTTLVGRAGANESQRADFIRSFLPPHRRSEYGFRGLLGSGKFHNDREHIPYIDYDPADRNDERDAIVDNVNGVLRSMFTADPAFHSN